MPIPAIDAHHHADGRLRCSWPGTDPLYVTYHDTEWGVPELDGRALFEKLILDGFQAGLAWITILRKRNAFKAAFDGFQPGVIAGYDEEKIASLMQNTGIVRNKAKIEATVRGARAWLEIERETGFSRFLWSFCGNRPSQTDLGDPPRVPVVSATSHQLSSVLKTKGFGFCGPTIVYAFMQAVGMVNDHSPDCFRRRECAALADAAAARLA